MSRLNDLVTEDRRLRLLALLRESNCYTASADLLQTVLASMGHAVSGDRLNTELEWLHEQGLVTLEQVGAGVHAVPMASLTMRGSDVALGVATVPGVARPRPE